MLVLFVIVHIIVIIKAYVTILFHVNVHVIIINVYVIISICYGDVNSCVVVLFFILIVIS